MKTILAIDDDPWVLETLRQALTARGYEVLCADSAHHGTRVLSQRRVDLILLDLNMPDKNGFVLYRDLESLRRIPVLFVTGCTWSFTPSTEGFTSIWTDGFTLGMTDILYKPFPISLLYEKVEALVGRSEVSDNGQVVRP